MTRPAIPALLLTLALAACSAPPPDEQTAATERSQAAAEAVAQPAPVEETAEPAPKGGCDDTQAQWIIGKAATPQDLEQARKDANADAMRSLKPSDAATMDFNPNRLNIDLDEKGVATAVRCG